MGRGQALTSSVIIRHYTAIAVHETRYTITIVSSPTRQSS
jgi:hypothetical protein